MSYAHSFRFTVIFLLLLALSACGGGGGGDEGGGKGGDTTAPVIGLSGTTPVTVEAGSTYTDASAAASDDVDGNISANIVTANTVNTAVVGTYSGKRGRYPLSLC